MAVPQAAGKALRPALVFLAAAAVNGTTPVSQADPATVRAAVAVELVHNFSLIHDGKDTMIARTTQVVPNPSLAFPAAEPS